MATKLYDSKWVNDTFIRIADEIFHNRVPGTAKALIGLRTRGAVMAERIQRILKDKHDLDLPIGYLDATMYRDDLHTGAGLKSIQPSEVEFDLNTKNIIMIDDVLSTGRTIRAAMGALFDYGRPNSVRLCVMLDRGGRELPIHADFCGAKIEVPKGGFVRLKLKEIDSEDAVYVVGANDTEP